MKNIFLILLCILISFPTYAQVTPPGTAGDIVINGGDYQFSAVAVGNTLTESVPTSPESLNVTQKLPRSTSNGTDTILSTDYGMAINYTGSGTTVTFPVASSSAFFAGFGVLPGNFGSGLVTLSTSTDSFVTPYGNITTILVPVGMSCYLYSDGTNWQVDPSNCPPINLVPQGYTVATLPTGVTGWKLYVTDAMTCTLNGSLTGGGSVKCPVWYNGSVWVGD